MEVKTINESKEVKVTKDRMVIISGGGERERCDEKEYTGGSRGLEIFYY